MNKKPAIIPVSHLIQNAARVLKEIRSSNDPVFITQRGRAAAVLMSVDAYRRRENEREILFLLASGEKEIASGVSYSLSSVMAEADTLLAEA